MTADPETLRQLLARVEGAAGADREIDGDLVLAFYGYPDSAPPSAQRYYKWTHEDGAKVWKSHGSDFAAYNIIWDAPAYTASVDAALALVGRVMPDASVQLEQGAYGDGWRAVLWVDHDPRAKEWAATPALALLAALLRAKIAETDNG